MENNSKRKSSHETITKGMTPYHIDRFRSKMPPVQIPDTCWEWAGGRDKTGYGIFCIGTKAVLAHRVSYRVAYGPFGEELKVRHICDNPPCCNPAHLIAGTQADNVQDMINRKRHQTGEARYNALLSDRKAFLIRGLKAELNLSRSKLSDIFGVSVGTIRDVLSRKTWNTELGKSDWRVISEAVMVEKRGGKR